MTPTGSLPPPARQVLLIAMLLVGAPLAGAAVPSHQAQVPIEELRLANGMKLLLVHQPESTTVAAGWMARVGSGDDPADRTGLSHLLEHLMFKGTPTVGTRDPVQEQTILDQIDALSEQRRLATLDLEDLPPKKRSKVTRQIEQMSNQIAALDQQAEKLAYLGEFSLLYSEQGGSHLDANTLQDLTLYYVTLPSDKLELWFWLESERLLRPVFRQFHKEIGVIDEERRLRIESTPTGPVDEELRAVFWEDHPYSWNPMGHGDHLESVSRAEATEFFRLHYRADNLTAALVGGFDPERVADWAQRYFGRLPHQDLPPAETAPAAQPATDEKRMESTCSCPPQAQILYPSARFGQADNYALQLLSAILNGRTGRLYRDLVLGQQIAFSAFTQQVPWRRAGMFSFRAESKGETDPEGLVVAWDQQVSRLQSETPSQEEIDRARNRLTADAFRSLKEPVGLMKQLLIYEGLGDWRYLNHWSGRIQQVTPEDVVGVARKYLSRQRRTVAIYRRSPGESIDEASGTRPQRPDGGAL